MYKKRKEITSVPQQKKERKEKRKVLEIKKIFPSDESLSNCFFYRFVAT